MPVAIDESGHNDHVTGIDNLSAVSRNIPPYFPDDAALNEDTSAYHDPQLAVHGDDGPTPYDNSFRRCRHLYLLHVSSKSLAVPASDKIEEGFVLLLFTTLYTSTETEKPAFSQFRLRLLIIFER
jgi:hypothetical protein